MTTYAEMKCECCGVHISETPLFRANPKGEKGRWRCEGCIGAENIDPLVLEITDAISDPAPREEGQSDGAD